MKVCGRLLVRDNEVTICWVPAHSKMAGNEKADEYAKAAARRLATCSDDEVPDELRQEASLSHMSTEAGCAPRQSGSPATLALVGTAPPRGEASAASIYAAH